MRTGTPATAEHSPDPELQAELLSHGAEEILPQGELLDRLRRCRAERRPLRVKQGFDPTAPDIHLGHTVGLRKLRQFQELGHQVVLIVGDYTGMVGDPSGRSKTRPQLTAAEVEANAAHLPRAVLSRARARPRAAAASGGDPPQRRVVREHALRGRDPARVAVHGGARARTRRLRQALAAKQPISLHELFYPLMQGYDSVAIRADVELGATEQKFNLLVGRTLQELHGQSPQIILTLPVLPGLDGVQRMSKSLGNYIGVTDPPAEMFGKVMSLPDAVMRTLLAARERRRAGRARRRRARALREAASRQPDEREEAARPADGRHVPRCRGRRRRRSRTSRRSSAATRCPTTSLSSIAPICIAAPATGATPGVVEFWWPPGSRATTKRGPAAGSTGRAWHVDGDQRCGGDSSPRCRPGINVLRARAQDRAALLGPGPARRGLRARRMRTAPGPGSFRGAAPLLS